MIILLVNSSAFLSFFSEMRKSEVDVVFVELSAANCCCSSILYSLHIRHLCLSFLKLDEQVLSFPAIE